MSAETSNVVRVHGLARGVAAQRTDINTLRNFAIVAGLGAAALFVVVGVRYDLQLYGDGSIFSYAVAVQDAWDFHWHNISGRFFVYLASLLPAEKYVELSGDPRGGIVFYGFLFFVTQALGLAGTYIADRSPGRIVFAYACASTAALCPLVFGFPTEVWMTHALFWLTLALCHYARGGVTGFLLVLTAMLALVFTHRGGMVFAMAILATLLLRGPREFAFLRAASAYIIVMAIWFVLHAAFPPDDYFGPVLTRAAMHVFDLSICTGKLVRLLAATLAGYVAIYATLRRFSSNNAHLHAACIVALALSVYWLWFDQALHTQNRYYLRTGIIVATPALGVLAAAFALHADGRLKRPFPLLPGLMRWLSDPIMVRAAIGALSLVLLVHVVETAKFVVAWTHYRNAIHQLATGNASDPALGDTHFVSSARIPANLNRLSWFSTTPYLSILMAPNFSPARLVVDPTANYFWLSCETARDNLKDRLAMPSDARRLIKIYSCLHRR
jgi:hypothetical protein